MLPFPPTRSRNIGEPPQGDLPSPVGDLANYARSGPDDDYRHRMLTNAIALAFCVALVAGGVWLAIKIAEMRANQDCVLYGRRDCAQLSISSGGAR